MRTTTPRRLLATVLAPVAALSLAACGGGDDEDGSDEPASDADLVVRGLDGIRWDKDAYAVTAGEVVIELRNDSSQPHTLAVVAEDGTQIGQELDAPTPNDRDSGTFALEAGTYRILCTVVGHGNMNSELTVS